MIHEVGNIELCELLETEPKAQCKVCLSYWDIGIVYCTCGHFLRRGREENQKFIKYTMDLLSVPEYVIKKGRFHGHRYGKKPGDREYCIANQLKKKCKKRCFQGIHDRFIRDESSARTWLTTVETRKHASSIVAWKVLRWKRMFLWMDQRWKNHISSKTGFGYLATRRTSFLSWFQACQRVVPPVLILQLQWHLQDRRVLHPSSSSSSSSPTATTSDSETREREDESEIDFPPVPVSNVDDRAVTPVVCRETNHEQAQGIHDRFIRDETFRNQMIEMVETKMFVDKWMLLRTKIIPSIWHHKNISITEVIGCFVRTRQVPILCQCSADLTSKKHCLPCSNWKKKKKLNETNDGHRVLLLLHGGVGKVLGGLFIPMKVTHHGDEPSTDWTRRLVLQVLGTILQDMIILNSFTLLQMDRSQLTAVYCNRQRSVNTTPQMTYFLGAKRVQNNYR